MATAGAFEQLALSQQNPKKRAALHSSTHLRIGLGTLPFSATRQRAAVLRGKAETCFAMAMQFDDPEMVQRTIAEWVKQGAAKTAEDLLSHGTMYITAEERTRLGQSIVGEAPEDIGMQLDLLCRAALETDLTSDKTLIRRAIQGDKAARKAISPAIATVLKIFNIDQNASSRTVAQATAAAMSFLEQNAQHLRALQNAGAEDLLRILSTDCEVHDISKETSAVQAVIEPTNARGMSGPLAPASAKFKNYSEAELAQLWDEFARVCVESEQWNRREAVDYR